MTSRPISGAALLAAVAWLCGYATPVIAHTKSMSYASWHIDGSRVHLSITLPLIEAARLASQAGEQPTNDQVAQYLAPRLGVSAAGMDCAPARAVKPLSATAQFRRFDFEFHCVSDQQMVLRSAIFIDLVPSHVSLAQIVSERGETSQQVFSRETQIIALNSNEDGGSGAGFLKYVRMGIAHIFTGVDHMSFLLGLMLISRRIRDLIFVVTGFTIGHSVTLALAVTGIIRPHAEFIDALVAFTIAMIGAENIVVETHGTGAVAAWVGGVMLLMALGSLSGLGGLPPIILAGTGLFAACYLMMAGQLRDAARLRILVTLVFGLVHGFGFAADLLELRLPSGELASILFGFNLGVEIGQLTLVLGCLLFVALLSKLRLTMSRPLVVEMLSSGLVALGLYWFIGRSYG